MGSHEPLPPRPRFPFFKDETGIGIIGRHVTLKTSVRAFLVAMIIGTLLIGTIGWYGLTQVEDLHTLINSRHSDSVAQQEREKAIIAQNRSDAFQQVAQLACSFANTVPPGQYPFVDQLRKTYGCPPYGTLVPSSGVTVAPTPTAQPTGTSVAPNGQPSGQKTTPKAAGPVITGPATLTSVDTSTPTPSSPVPSTIVSDTLCRVLGVFCP